MSKGEEMHATMVPQIELLSVDQLTIDPRYQRTLDEKRAKKIANEFKWDQFGVLEVSERDGDQHAVFDGQHRLHAAHTLGLDSVPCLIHTGLTPQEESVLFTLLQTQRRGLSQLDRFHAQVFADDPQSLAIAAVVERAGFKVSNDKGARTITAVQALERIYRRFGGEILDQTLRETATLWEGDKGATHGKFLVGVAHFLAGYGDNRYTDEVRDRLREVAPEIILRRAGAVNAGGGSGLAKTIYEELRRVARVKGRPRVFKKAAAQS